MAFFADACAAVGQLVNLAVRDTLNAIRAQGFAKMCSRPVSAYAAVTLAVIPARPKGKRRASFDEDTLSMTRHLAMALVPAFWVIGGPVVRLGHFLSEPWKLLALSVGSTIVAVPVVSALTVQISGLVMSRDRLVNRFAGDAIGRRLDKIVWNLAVACGIGMAIWLSQVD